MLAAIPSLHIPSAQDRDDKLQRQLRVDITFRRNYFVRVWGKMDMSVK